MKQRGKWGKEECSKQKEGPKEGEEKVLPENQNQANKARPRKATWVLLSDEAKCVAGADHEGH